MYARFTNGDALAGQNHISIRGRKSRGRTERAIIICPGHQASGVTACLQWAMNAQGGPPHVQYLTDYGYGLLAADAGGPLAWGNDAAVASNQAIDKEVQWVRGANGWANPNLKVALLGYSMGGLEVTNYATRFPANVAGVLLEAPALDLDKYQANSVDGYQAEINTAYGGNYATNAVGHKPFGFASTFATPTKIYVASDDVIVTPADSTTFYNALPAASKQGLTLLPGGGHTNFWQYIQPPDVLAWLNGLAW
jgi:hypothetical protein